MSDKLVLGDKINFVQFYQNRMVWRADHLIAERDFRPGEKIAVVMHIAGSMSDSELIELHKLMTAEV